MCAFTVSSACVCIPGAVRVWMYDCVDVGVHVNVCTEMYISVCIKPKILGEVCSCEVGRKAPE